VSNKFKVLRRIMINHISGACTFEAGEDLLNESKTQILIFRNTTKSIDLSNPRTFLSYCSEFCGMTGLSYQTLRFQHMGRDIKQETQISDSAHITVSHKAEFAIEPPNSLKSSMKAMLMNTMYADIVLKLDKKGDHMLHAHRCVLYMRSKPLKDRLDMIEKGNINIHAPPIRSSSSTGPILTGGMEGGNSPRGLLLPLSPIGSKQSISSNTGGNINLVTKFSGALDTLPAHALHDECRFYDDKVLGKSMGEASVTAQTFEDVVSTSFGGTSGLLLVQEDKDLIPKHTNKFLSQIITQTTPDGKPILDLSEVIGEDSQSRHAFIAMVNFLYSGEIVFPKNPIETTNILRFAKEFQVEDLEEICEDEIVKKLEPQTCVEILVSFEQNIKVSEETAYRVKTYFLKNFEQIAILYPDIEEKLAKCPGLIKKLFLHISGKRKFKRKVTFVDFDFNVSHDL
jgi:BTB/POZ domain